MLTPRSGGVACPTSSARTRGCPVLEADDVVLTERRHDGPSSACRDPMRRWSAAPIAALWPACRITLASSIRLLLRRKTWQIWEWCWPHHDRGDPVSYGINVLPKYVPSTTLTDPTWQDTRVIGGDVEAAVRELKARPRRGAPGPWQEPAAPVAARARPRRPAQPAHLSGRGWGWAPSLPGAGPDARPDAGRVAVDAVRRDDPNVSTWRAATFGNAG